ncbi:MAG TPA: transposase [Chitinophagaceae bacterium]|nr:transposase [Chitinophagaceae bacterium]
MKQSLKPRRIFSVEMKREIVKQIEENKIGVVTASREYGVNRTSVYNWLNKYSRTLKRGQTIVVEKESEQRKNEELRAKIAELERIIGRKQMEIDFLNKVIEIGSEEVKVDIKKKFGGKLSTGSESTGEPTTGK